jgi:glycosyltransferase
VPLTFERWGLHDTSYDISADYDAVLCYLSMGTVRLSYLPRVMGKMRAGESSNGAIWWEIFEDYQIICTHQIGGISVLAQKNIRKISQLYPAR